MITFFACILLTDATHMSVALVETKASQLEGVALHFTLFSMSSAML